ncbi:Methyl-accepting chemotaxis sensor/transducer protein [hydrothermal vent metagenome]|uniref:Methyl-accepting chemotaxis sensor/transducer protein n=1 Tax=hydrothermal vent metagenome TaxID=652676 RepID=A0A3B0XYF2_9ZZZZ
MGIFNTLTKIYNEMGIASKFGFVTAITLSVLLFSSSKITLSLQDKSLDTLLSSSKSVVDEMSRSQINANKESDVLKVNQLLKVLAQIAPSAIADFDFSGLLNYSNVVAEDPDISYVAFIDRENHVLASSGNIKAASENGIIEKEITYDGVIFGKVVIGYNHNRSNLQISVAQEKTQSHIGDMITSKTDSYDTIAASQTILTLIIIFIASTIIYSIARFVTKPLSTAISIAHQIADGDLTAQINVHSKDETGQLLASMKVMLTNLKQMVQQIDSATSQLGSTAGDMFRVTESTVQGANRQQNETDQLANAIVEMSASANEVLKNATQAENSAHSADTEASNGKQVVTKTIEEMNRLANDVYKASEVIQNLDQQSDSIGSVLDVIRNIADQTNLLALNAAIEAARAGEQGRGFAVVADEVRTLAGRTQSSTQEIQQMIENLQTGTIEAVKVMNLCRERAESGVNQAAQAGHSLDALTHAITSISEMNTQIVTASKEQSAVTEELERNITTISQVATKTAEETQITSESSEKLNQLSDALLSIVNRFNISEKSVF